MYHECIGDFLSQYSVANSYEVSTKNFYEILINI